MGFSEYPSVHWRLMLSLNRWHRQARSTTVQTMEYAYIAQKYDLFKIVLWSNQVPPGPVLAGTQTVEEMAFLSEFLAGTNGEITVFAQFTHLTLTLSLICSNFSTDISLVSIISSAKRRKRGKGDMMPLRTNQRLSFQSIRGGNWVSTFQCLGA